MNKNEILDTDNIFSLLLKLSVPTIIAGVVSALYNMVDSIFVGKFIGDKALAALTISNTVQLFLIAFTALCSFGTGVLVSRYLGAKDNNKLYKTLYSGIIGVTVITGFVSLFVLLFLEHILIMIGATPDILMETENYISVILWFGFVTPLNGVLASLLRARGQTVATMRLALLGAVLNIILDAIFIVWFDWGVFGAGLATVFAQCLVLIVSFYYLNKFYQLLLDTVEFDASIFYNIIKIGIPSGVRLSVLVISSFSANQALQAFGYSALASYGISNRIISLFFMVIQGFNFGMQPALSFNFGAKNFDRINQIVKTSFLSMFILGVFGSLFFVLLPVDFFSLFSHSLQIQELSKESLFYFGICFSFFSCYMFLSGCVQCFGYTKEAIFLSLIRPLTSALLYYIFPVFWGLKGIWFVTPVTDMISIAIALIVFINVFKNIKQISKTPTWTSGDII